MENNMHNNSESSKKVDLNSMIDIKKLTYDTGDFKNWRSDEWEKVAKKFTAKKIDVTQKEIESAIDYLKGCRSCNKFEYVECFDNLVTLLCKNNDTKNVCELLNSQIISSKEEPNKLDLNKKINGKLPLEYAIDNGNMSIIDELIKYGILFDKKNREEINKLIEIDNERDSDKVKACKERVSKYFKLIEKCLDSSVSYEEFIELSKELDIHAVSEIVARCDYNPIIKMIQEENIERLESFFDSKNKYYSIFIEHCNNFKDKNGNTALIHAINKKNNKVIEMLLNNSGTRNINETNNQGYSALDLACEMDDNYELTMKLVKKGADLLSGSKYKKQNDKIIENIKKLDDNQKYDILFNASKKGGRFIIDFLIKELKIDINRQDEYGCTPTMYACFSGDISTAVPLIFNNMYNKLEIDRKDNNGKTAFMYACQINNYTIATQLIEAGADISGITTEQTDKMVKRIKKLNDTTKDHIFQGLIKSLDSLDDNIKDNNIYKFTTKLIEELGFDPISISSRNQKFMILKNMCEENNTKKDKSTIKKLCQDIKITEEELNKIKFNGLNGKILKNSLKGIVKSNSMKIV